MEALHLFKKGAQKLKKRELILSNFDISSVENKLNKAFDNNSETELLSIIKDNSFLLYSLYSRKYGIQPNFAEVPFGAKLRSDFLWLNDNSDGPEWVLVEIEKPKMKLFTQKNEPTHELNHAIEQVKSWQRYFREQPHEKNNIFGAVSRFKYILVAGCIEDWETEHASKWRISHNDETSIEIRSSNIFYQALKSYKQHKEEFWSFQKNPISLKSSSLQNYWKEYKYFNHWRKIL